MQLESFSSAFFFDSTFRFLNIALLTIVLCFPAAFFASFNRGYLAPFGYIIFILIFSQLLSAVGYGEYFPWALPALYSGLSGVKVDYELIHFFSISGASALGIVSTSLFWEYADHDE